MPAVVDLQHAQFDTETAKHVCIIHIYTYVYKQATVVKSIAHVGNLLNDAHKMHVKNKNAHQQQ